MLSIIICSVSPERLEETKSNFEKTIGKVKYEIISHDNRSDKFPIAKVYNLCARKANFNNLFFVHEDVRFLEYGWGEKIEEKLKEPDCGVIGFTGSVLKTAAYSGWSLGFPKYDVSYYHSINEGKQIINNANLTSEEGFKEVVTLDGLGMFVRKDVFEQYPFDEQALTGFHCYDLDFTMQIARSGFYRNWCCHCDVLHLSNGSFDENWRRSIVSIHDNKWSGFLPLTVKGYNISHKEMKRLNETALWQFFKTAVKEDSSLKWHIFWTFCKLPKSLWQISKMMSGLKKLLAGRRVLKKEEFQGLRR